MENCAGSSCDDKSVVTYTLFFKDDEDVSVELVNDLSNDRSCSVTCDEIVVELNDENIDNDVLHYKIDNDDKYGRVMCVSDDDQSCSKMGDKAVKDEDLIKYFVIPPNSISCALKSKYSYYNFNNNVINLNFKPVKKIHKGRTHECSIEGCKSRFFHYGMLRQHQLLHSKKEFSCKYCNKVYNNLDRVKEHEALHFDENGRVILYSCRIRGCYKIFETRYLLFRHEATHDPSKTVFVCYICDKKFRLRPTYRRHLQCHNKTISYSCLECGKCFKNKFSLYDHKRVHMSCRTFACDICTAEFYKVGNYYRHLQVHKSKRHLCKICGSTFKYHCSLTKHMIGVHPIARSKQLKQTTEIFRKKSILSTLHRLKFDYKL